MKKTFTLIICSIVMQMSFAQSRIFKEVAEGISTTTKTIFQDNAVVGYVAFTKLEKASEDSFNYKLTIMDENLNNIGEQNLKDVNLSLSSVGFESDVLCLSFYSSNTNSEVFKSKKQVKEAKENALNKVINKFMTLEGNIIKTQVVEVEPITSTAVVSSRKRYVTSYLQTSGTIKNIANKGFAFMYADNAIGQVIMYNTKGELLWKKNFTKYPVNLMLTNSKGVYVLSKDNTDLNVGGYVMNNFAVEDGKATGEIPIETPDDDATLSILNFELNPHTNNPYIAGVMVKNKYKDAYPKAKTLKAGKFKGVFTYTFNGIGKKEIVKNYSYYANLSDSYTSKGRKKDNNYYTVYSTASQDASGVTHFTGDYIERKTRIGGAVTSVLFSFLIYPPLVYAYRGSGKYRVVDAAVIKQTLKGDLIEETTLGIDKSRFVKGGAFMYSDVINKYYSLYDATSKSDYVVYTDKNNNNLYNITTKKYGRKIPFKDGKNYQYIAPAKEGHILVIENNTKEKYTKLSIEPI